MCGIFAYVGRWPLQILDVLEVLRVLEEQQEADESTPVGGHGAGIAYFNVEEKLILNKVGKAKHPPVEDLRRQIKNTKDKSQFILSHVRHASPEFEHTIKYRECAQPYHPRCSSNFIVVSAHNGFAKNYEELETGLQSRHSFESEKIDLIDSEVISHLFEELLAESEDPWKATSKLFAKVDGTKKQGNTIIVLSRKKNDVCLNAIQKGRTRGLVVWSNSENGILLCSRENPVKQILSEFLAENEFHQTISVRRLDSINMEIHFGMKLLE
jgi:glucosamine 6-phosphate synthetase-like amidotransferase/phosphosugar isomerase protein